MRILLAEDNAMNVELFLAALKGEGHEVTVEHDGVAARGRALHEAFDVIALASDKQARATTGPRRSSW